LLAGWLMMLLLSRIKACCAWNRAETVLKLARGVQTYAVGAVLLASLAYSILRQDKLENIDHIHILLH
jgi:hypothetical protein